MSNFLKRALKYGKETTEKPVPEPMLESSMPACAPSSYSNVAPSVGADRTKESQNRSTNNPREKAVNLGLKILYEPPERNTAIVDIVFVHGLTGSAYSTWMHKTGLYWPERLLPHDITDARILSFGYDADVAHFWALASSNTVGNHAENMLGALTRLRERTDSEERKIIFVAHSLGGLVTKNALTLAAQSAEKHIKNTGSCVTAIAFLGTPHHGADLAAWATTGSRIANTLKQSNTEILAVLKPRSEILASISKAFHDLLRNKEENLDMTCFYEEMPVRLVGEIVPKHSAIIQGYSSYGIHANHMDMTKFESADDPGYMAVSGELRRWVKALRVVGDKIRQEILTSLMFDDLHRNSDVLDQHVPSTYEWIWSREKSAFANWIGTNDPLFWISGKPGSGKSTLMRYLAKAFNSSQVPILECEERSGNTPRLTAAYFFDFASNKLSRSLEAALRALVYQLLVKEPEILKAVLPFYNRRKASRKNSPLYGELDYLKACLRAIALFAPKYACLIFIDALDESVAEPFELADFIVSMGEEIKSTGLQVCISSRPYISFVDHFTPLSRLVMEEKTAVDIEVYVRIRFNNAFGQWLDGTDQISDEITKRSEGVFLWVKLVTELLIRAGRKGEDTGRLRQRVKEYPKKLDVFYQRMLDDLDDEDYEESRIMLAMVSRTVSPLSPLDLRFAVHYYCGSYATDLANPVLASKRILAICPGLLEIRQPWRPSSATIADDSDGEVHLAHQTVKSFLISKRDQGLRKFQDDSFVTGNVMLLKSCIISLQTWVARIDKRLEFQANQPGGLVKGSVPFLRYAQAWWYLHAKEASRETGRVLPALKSFSMHQYQVWRHQNPTGILRIHTSVPFVDEHSLALFTNARGLAYIGIPESLIELALALDIEALAEFLLLRNTGTEHSKMLNAVAISGNTSLAGRILKRAQSMGKMPEIPQSAFCRAIYFGHVGLSRLMLQYGADPDLQAVYWEYVHGYPLRGSPLQIAIRMHHQSLIELLFEFKADFNAYDSDYGTPIAVAAQCGFLDIVAILLRLGATANIQGQNELNSALAAAIHSSDTDWCLTAISTLLAQGADPNYIPPYSNVPLICTAIENYSPQAVKSLLDHGVRVNTTVDGGHTVLYKAIQLYRETGDSRLKEISNHLIEHGSQLTETEQSSFGLPASRTCRKTELCHVLEDFDSSSARFSEEQALDLVAQQMEARAFHAIRAQERHWDFIRMRDTPSTAPGTFSGNVPSKNTAREATKTLHRWAGINDLVQRENESISRSLTSKGSKEARYPLHTRLLHTHLSPSDQEPPQSPLRSPVLIPRRRRASSSGDTNT